MAILVLVVFVGVILLLKNKKIEKIVGIEKNHEVTPLEMLKKRYANGEITKEEYKEIFEELK